MSDNTGLLLKSNLKHLRLPTILAEFEKLAREASSANGKSSPICNDRLRQRRELAGDDVGSQRLDEGRQGIQAA